MSIGWEIKSVVGHVKPNPKSLLYISAWSFIFDIHVGCAMLGILIVISRFRVTNFCMRTKMLYVS